MTIKEKPQNQRRKIGQNSAPARTRQIDRMPVVKSNKSISHNFTANTLLLQHKILRDLA